MRARAGTNYPGVDINLKHVWFDTTYHFEFTFSYSKLNFYHTRFVVDRIDLFYFKIPGHQKADFFSQSWSLIVS